MLMFVQVKYQLRIRGRSVLGLCIAALLAACMAFYVGTIGVNKAALQSLSDSVPVTVRITSRPLDKGGRARCAVYRRGGRGVQPGGARAGDVPRRRHDRARGEFA